MALGTMATIGLMAAGGAGIASAARGNRDKVDNKFLMNPEYAENTGARELWWKKLQEWGQDPNYGAISPDWNNIWETVQNRVRQHYEGGPLKPGVKDRVRASLARRGMSENPASDYLLAQTDIEQGNTLSDIATQQGISQAEFGEKGRQTWLESLMSLEARKPSGQWQTTIRPDKTNAILGAVGNIGSSLATAGISNMAMQNQNAMLEKLMTRNSVPMAVPGANGYGTNTPWGVRDTGEFSLLPNRNSAWGRG